MDLSEIRLEDLDIEDLKKLGGAPIAVKAAIIVVLCIMVIAAGYFLDTTKQMAILETAAQKEQTLRQIFIEKQSVYQKREGIILKGTVLEFSFFSIEIENNIS